MVVVNEIEERNNAIADITNDIEREQSYLVALLKIIKNDDVRIRSTVQKIEWLKRVRSALCNYI